jgi:flagellar basal body-associated protein FliL
MDNDHKRSNKKSGLKLIILILGALLVIFCIAGMIFFYNEYQELKNNPTAAVKQETVILVEDVNKLMVLPKGEDPTVATVTDKDKLSSQTFFKDAQNGDKLLAYTIAQKAILYRPSIKKIINIAPFSLDAVSTDDTQ